jgi:hypothetical protein
MGLKVCLNTEEEEEEEEEEEDDLSACNICD